MKRSLKVLLTVVFLFPVLLVAQTLEPEDVAEYSNETGVGCMSKKPVTGKADFYHVCKSKKSGEVAWNAALYLSKVACSSDQLLVYFNVPPSIPTENGIFGAQVEVSCEK